MFVFYLLLIAVGVFMIVVAVFNWDAWFYDADSYLIGLIGGETMVRWYWGIAGASLIVLTLTEWIWGWGFQAARNWGIRL